MSGKYRLNFSDVKRVLINFALYNVPMWLLTFLTAISQDVDIKKAALTASITLVTALVDVMRKFKEGAENDGQD